MTDPEVMPTLQVMKITVRVTYPMRAKHAIKKTHMIIKHGDDIIHKTINRSGRWHIGFYIRTEPVNLLVSLLTANDLL